MTNSTVMDAIGDDEVLLARLIILQRKMQDSNDIYVIREGFVKLLEVLDEAIAKEEAKSSEILTRGSKHEN